MAENGNGNGKGYDGTYTAQQFIDAIPGTGGIMTAIAKRVGCAWNTAKKYCYKYPTVTKVLEDEREGTLDLAETIFLDNLKLTRQLQVETQAPVDTGDVRWYLATVGKDRGYVPRSEHSGPDGGAIAFADVSPRDTLTRRLDSIAEREQQKRDSERLDG